MMVAENQVPRQVREANDEADRILAEQQAQMELESAETPPVEPAPQPVEDPAPAEPAVTAPQEAEQIAALQQQLELERQRNETLQGKYTAEVPRLSAEVRELKQSIGQRQQQPATPAQPDVPAYMRHVKPDEVEEFGEDALDVQSRVARGEMEAVLERERQKGRDLEDRLAQLESAQRQRQNDGLWDRVEAVSPGAKAINDSDLRFGEWLKTVEPTSGRTYADLGVAAVNGGDVKRLAELVDEFKSVTPGHATNVVKGQAQPAQVQTRPSGREPQKRRVKASEIKKFYDDISLPGRFRGTDAEKQAKIDEYDAAAEGGRVVRG